MADKFNNRIFKKPNPIIIKKRNIDQSIPVAFIQPTITICVVGWYFFPELYKTLLKLKESYTITIIAHQQSELLKNHQYKLVKNEGLEWGAYHHYLEDVWDEKSDIIFLHDDIQIDLESFKQIITKFQRYSEDMVYIDESRLFSLKKSAILKLGTIRYDISNHGVVYPIGGRYVNRGINMFREDVRKKNLTQRRIFGKVRFGLRGTIR